MIQAKNGDIVKVHYTGKHTNGQVFDSSAGREPLAFALGAGQMIAGFEQAVLGMQIGEKKTIHIQSADAYGDLNESLIFPVSLASIPEDMEIQVGMMLNAQADNGMPIQVVVKQITSESVILDANHPLAGQDLVFEIELLEINSPEDADKKPLLFD